MAYVKINIYNISNRFLQFIFSGEKISIFIGSNKFYTIFFRSYLIGHCNQPAKVFPKFWSSIIDDDYEIGKSKISNSLASIS